MRKPIAILTVLMLATLTLPATSAGEIVEESYTGALGYSVEGVGYRAYVIFPNSEDSIFTQNGIRPIGGVRLNAENAWTNLVITLNDGVYGADAAAATCFWNPDGDNSCSTSGDNPDYPSDIACGGAALLGSPFSGDYATVFLFTVHVAEDLTACGGSTGSVVGNFF